MTVCQKFPTIKIQNSLTIKIGAPVIFCIRTNSFFNSQAGQVLVFLTI